MKTLSWACCVLPAMALSGAVQAATLDFTGTALPGCTLGVPTPGVLTLGTDYRTWTTTVPATIAVTNTAPSTLSVTAPSQWASHPGTAQAMPDTTFAITYGVTGTNLISQLTGSGNTLLNLIGVNELSVSLGATAEGTRIFPSGTYTAQVTVTCSPAL